MRGPGGAETHPLITEHIPLITERGLKSRTLKTKGFAIAAILDIRNGDRAETL
jgi:hypothetical protein